MRSTECILSLNVHSSVKPLLKSSPLHRLKNWVWRGSTCLLSQNYWACLSNKAMAAECVQRCVLCRDWCGGSLSTPLPAQPSLCCRWRCLFGRASVAKDQERTAPCSACRRASDVKLPPKARMCGLLGDRHARADAHCCHGYYKQKHPLLNGLFKLTDS